MNPVAMILAGGEGSRLTVLSEERAKPAVPFAGKFRIIDFAISNCIHSDIYSVGILTQYRPHSLNEHIGIGKPWGLDRSRGGVKLLPPYHARGNQSWYNGTADAIYQNLGYIDDEGAEEVLILSGDHIYKMDYRLMLEHHRKTGADLTVAVMEVPIEEASRFGIMQVDDNDAIIRFAEKPKDKSLGNLASLGIYIFNQAVLKNTLNHLIHRYENLDFGKHVIPYLVSEQASVQAYRYQGYWVDVGTVASFLKTNLDMAQAEEELDLYQMEWPILTRSEEYPPVLVHQSGRVMGSLVSNGCVVQGDVVNSVLSPGVQVAPGARVEGSVIMNDTWIGPGAVVRNTVIDKNVWVGPGAEVGGEDTTVFNKDFPDKLTEGITVIGKGARIPEGCRVGSHVLVNSNRTEDDFPDGGCVSSGEVI